MKMQVQITGLDKVRSLSSRAPSVLNQELRKGVRDAAAVIRSQAIANIRTFQVDNTFAQSIRYLVTSGTTITATIGSMAATALSIEVGRKPGEIVKLGLIRRWVERRHIFSGVYSLKTKRIMKQRTLRAAAGNDISKEELRLAVALVEQIRLRGTKAHAFLIPAFAQQRAKVERLIREGVDRALNRLMKAA